LPHCEYNDFLLSNLYLYNDPATTYIYTLSLHDALPILQFRGRVDYNLSESLKLYVSYNHQHDNALNSLDVLWGPGGTNTWAAPTDRKSTRLNSSHVAISYAVFCLKKKNNIKSKLIGIAS